MPAGARRMSSAEIQSAKSALEQTKHPFELLADDSARKKQKPTREIAKEEQMAHSNQAEFESWHNAMMGTPNKRAAKTPNSKRSSGKYTGDRFIPNRSAMDINVSNFELTRDRENPENADVNASPAKEEYKKELAANLFAGSSTNKVLAFSDKAPRPAEDHQNALRVLYSQNREAGLAPKKYTRHIPQAPERILDAPELLDDYYLNLLDWGKNNVAPSPNPNPSLSPTSTC